MNLIAISDNEMINADNIDSIEIRKSKEGKMIVITVGGKQHIPKIDSAQLLKALIKGGASQMANQFFAV